jgi:hypothetical protein
MMLKDFNETFDHELRDPDFAALYLKTALQDNGIDGFILALRNVARAKQGDGTISDASDFSSVYNLLASLGLQLSIEPAHHDALST